MVDAFPCTIYHKNRFDGGTHYTNIILVFTLISQSNGFVESIIYTSTLHSWDKKYYIERMGMFIFAQYVFNAGWKYWYNLKTRSTFYRLFTSHDQGLIVMSA